MGMMQRETTLLWVIDLAPIVIGFLAGLVGYRQQRLEQLNLIAEERYQEELKLKNEINELNLDLENRVEERTLEVEKRSSYLEAASEVGRAATSIYSLEDLLPRVADLISEKFEFYQVGIFIIDDQNEFAEMHAASSDGGKRMLARNHRLKLGEQGIVGYVTSTGQARIALDVGEDAVHFNTPELPYTRSEMALPLFYGGRIFGALDVQSTEPNAFSEQDISALNVLADQVSMAISNAMLFEELQNSLDAERKAYQKISSNAWQDYMRHTGSWGFKFTNNRISPTDSAWPIEMIQALEENSVINTNPDKPTLSLPIRIGDEAIGVIRVSKGTSQLDWAEDEIELIQVLTERLSQALESARLTVLKTAAKQLGDAFDAKEVVIRMAPNETKD
jgi:GAF domain-containing protein